MSLALLLQVRLRDGEPAGLGSRGLHRGLRLFQLGTQRSELVGEFLAGRFSSREFLARLGGLL